MLKVKLSSASNLKKSVDAIKEVLNDVTLKFTPEQGLHILDLDTTHCISLEFQLRRSAFVKYRCPMAIQFGVNLYYFARILKCANNNDELTIKGTPGLDYLSIKIRDEDSQWVTVFHLKLMNLDDNPIFVPAAMYKCNVSIDAFLWMKIINDLGQPDSVFTITCSKEQLQISSKGGEQSIQESNVYLSSGAANNDIQIVMDDPQPISLTFSARFLKFTTKGAGLTNRVQLSMAYGTPLLAEATLENIGYLRYYIAHRINEDEI